MTEEKTTLSHGRYLTRFAQLGPYLRREKSSNESYFFDCLSACVSAKKEPENREFWGWWLELVPKKKGFKYVYTYGKYDQQGDWLDIELPNKYTEEVKQSLEVFYQKISGFLEGELSLNIKAAPSFKGAKLGIKAK